MAQTEQDSPMWAQYKRIKAQYPDIILLFRLGDFYETFEDDAKLAAALLELTLTSKVIRSNKRTGEETRVAMAGMPHHAIESYLARLVGAGYRVAICEEMEDPKEKERERKEARERGEHRAKETPQEKLVRREVVRVVTPGTLTEPTLLQAERNSYIAAVIVEKGRAGLAYADISTGEFCLCELAGSDLRQQIEGELTRLQPAELLVPDEESLRLPGMEPARRKLDHDLEFMLKAERDRLLPHERLARKTDRALDTSWVQGQLTAWAGWRWEQRTARDALLQQLEVQSLQGYGCEDKPLAIRAAGALIQYLHETQRNAVAQIRGLRSYDVSTFMFLDPQTRRNLELLEGSKGGQKGSLVGVLDQTSSPMGARLLRRWVAQPLLDLELLRARQETVGRFVEDSLLRAELREQLKQLGDLERTVNRIIEGTAANPRDLVRLRSALRALPALDATLRMAGFEFADLAASPGAGAAVAEATSGSASSYDDDDLFGEHAGSNGHSAAGMPPGGAAAPSLRLSPAEQLFDLCGDMLELLERAIADDPPAMLDTWNNSAEENIIRRDFSPELGALIEASRDARDYITGLELKEQERTGIKSLKVGFNTVFGYYIELSKAVADQRVPPDYIRKQTLVNAERYFTEELKFYENIVLRSQEKLNELERRIFRKICQDITAHSKRLLETAATIGQLDVHAALAEVAVRNRYVRPRLNNEDCIRIKGGRHPVVEQAIDEPFVGNDIELSTSNEQILVITGPNMSGKSTFMRQVALIVLLAQIGSYVPAERAEIGMVDRIFTRIGAQDDIATGQSTFMVEMTETANILHNATPRSLIILDEIGRGTSTYDGLSIARAVVEYIHNQPRLRAKTLFATHYHELTELASVLPRVRNYNVAVAEEGDHVVFLRKIVPGGADRSYGIHVAQMAGMPPVVVRRAEEVLVELEGRGSKEQRREAMRRANQTAQPVPAAQMGLFAPEPLEPSPALELLRSLDVGQLTPLEALTKLYELQRLAGEA